MSSSLLTRPSQGIQDIHGMATVSPQMLAFFELAKRVARTHSSVLLRGETGTGKELVARMIHDMSPRSKGPFMAVNCATLTPELLISELFGHVRGAFTGAIEERQGLFSLAHEGSIFLDEIAELPMDLQSRLLRVLQERSFVPLGGTKTIRVDVRIISATHQALREEVAQKRFREDLMYRLRVVPLFLPRLAERDGDVRALTWHFIDVFNKLGGRHIERIESKTMDALESYGWPGNVRELSNTVEYAFAVGEGPILTLQDLTPELRGVPPRGSSYLRTEADLERERILKALEEAGGKKGDAAEALGMSRSTLWRKLKEHRI